MVLFCYLHLQKIGTYSKFFVLCFIDDTPISCTDDALALSFEDESHAVAESLVPNSGDGSGAENNVDNGVRNDINAFTTNGRLAPALYKDDDNWHSERRKTVRFWFKRAEGVSYTVKPKTPAEFVQLIFNDTLVDEIIEYTNKKGVMLLQTPKKH